MNDRYSSSLGQGSLQEGIASQHKRLHLTYIRAIAACAVVQMHAIGGYLYWYGKEAAQFHIQFIVADIYYSLLRWATPFFIMISGALLLGNPKEQPLGVFLSRRMQRVMIPFVFWGSIYLLYYFRGPLWQGPLPKWSEITYKILYEDIYFHLWFIPMIAGLYLLTPVLRIWTRAAGRRDLEYFLGLIFLFNMLHHYLPGLLVVRHFAWFGYIGYYLLGHYLNVYPIGLPWRQWLYIIAVFMPLVSAGIVWWMSAQKGAYDDTAFVYSSPNIVLMSAAGFVLLRDYNWEHFAQRYPHLHQIALYVAEVSFGVYFVHPLILDVLKNGYLGIEINPHAFLSIPVPIGIGGVLTGIIATALSVGLISLLRLSKFVRQWLT